MTNTELLRILQDKMLMSYMSPLVHVTCLEDEKGQSESFGLIGGTLCPYGILCAVLAHQLHERSLAPRVHRIFNAHLLYLWRKVGFPKRAWASGGDPCDTLGGSMIQPALDTLDGPDLIEALRGYVSHMEDEYRHALEQPIRVPGLLDEVLPDAREIGWIMASRRGNIDAY